MYVPFVYTYSYLLLLAYEQPTRAAAILSCAIPQILSRRPYIQTPIPHKPLIPSSSHKHPIASDDIPFKSQPSHCHHLR